MKDHVTVMCISLKLPSMSRSFPIIIGFILIATVGGLVYWQNSSRGIPTPSANATAGSSQSGGAVYTITEVAAHNSDASCWTVIDGSVYDLTQWIPQHPGGEGAIESICGIDGSAAFRAQHGTAQRQADILATYKIGSVSQ